MKFTFNTNKDVGYKKNGSVHIYKGYYGDSFVETDKKSIEYLKSLKEAGKPVFIVSEGGETVVEISGDMDVRLQFEQKFGKKVPNVKKNDIAWIENKLKETVEADKVETKKPEKVEEAPKQVAEQVEKVEATEDVAEDVKTTEKA